MILNLITGTLDGAIEVFEVIGGKNLGCLRSKGKCKKLELSYGSKDLAVLFESYQGSKQEIKIYDLSSILSQLKGTE